MGLSEKAIQELFVSNLRPSARAWLKHAGLLFATLVTTTLAGTLFPFGRIPTLPADDPATLGQAVDFLLSLPARYLLLVGTTVANIFSDASLLLEGLTFSVSLLLILVAHEMGHYVACRLYRVDATLPYFIPTPPLIGPAGTFGAFIKIRSPMPSRKAVFDIGVAGPLAGFAVLIPIAFIGVATLQRAPVEQLGQTGAIVFADPLLIKAFAWALGIDLAASVGNSFYFAGWVGLLVTALNLIPSGQLDGGHAVFAVFGEKVHWWTGRIAFGTMAAFSVLGWLFFNSPSGLLIAILLGVMMKIRHPIPWDLSPLDAKRKAVAFLTFVVFVLCFLPFPIQIL